MRQFTIRHVFIWGIALCTPVKVNRRFGGKYCLHIHGWRVCQAKNQNEAGSKHIQLFTIWLILIKIQEFTDGLLVNWLLHSFIHSFIHLFIHLFALGRILDLYCTDYLALKNVIIKPMRLRGGDHGLYYGSVSTQKLHLRKNAKETILERLFELGTANIRSWGTYQSNEMPSTECGYTHS
jgi:hypothetical protein